VPGMKTPTMRKKINPKLSSFGGHLDEPNPPNAIAPPRLRERVANFFAMLLLLPIVAASLYLWLGALGGSSLKKGLGVAGAICAFIAIANLPKEPAWARFVKGTVLAAGVLWVVSTFLPIEDEAGFVVVLLIAGAVGVVGYVMLFENFFD